MKRGARFYILDPKVAANADADWIVLDIPASQLGVLIEELEVCRSMSKDPSLKSLPHEVWCVHLLVEASHPKTVGKDPKVVKWPPSLLKDSIPREGGS